MSTPPRQLIVYRFPPGTGFQGQLVGALERIESGGAMRILDALFVGHDPESGELVAVSMSADGSAGMVGRLLSFRLEPKARTSATERVLEGPSGPLVRSLAATLEPGSAVTAVLVEHSWEKTLAEAITRIGGARVANEFVESDRIPHDWAEGGSPRSG